MCSIQNSEIYPPCHKYPPPPRIPSGIQMSRRTLQKEEYQKHPVTDRWLFCPWRRKQLSLWERCSSLNSPFKGGQDVRRKHYTHSNLLFPRVKPNGTRSSHFQRQINRMLCSLKEVELNHSAILPKQYFLTLLKPTWINLTQPRLQLGHKDNNSRDNSVSGSIMVVWKLQSAQSTFTTNCSFQVFHLSLMAACPGVF